MCYEIVQSISIRHDTVHLNSARRDLGAAFFREIEDPILSSKYADGGLHAVLKELGERVFLGSVILRPQNCRLTEYMRQASSLIQQPLSFFLDAGHAGEFIATVAEKLYTEPMYSSAEDLKKLESLRSDPKITLEICMNNPRAFNFSEINVRRDPKLAKQYIRQCVLHPNFVFPSYFVDDIDLAMTALRFDGRIFSQLDKSLRNNKRVARYAYNCTLKRTFNATDPIHLGTELLDDVEFLISLCACCPDLNVERTPFILQNPHVAKAWLMHNRNAFDHFHLLPRDVLQNTEVLRALYTLAGQDRDRIAKANLFVFQAETPPDTSYIDMILNRIDSE